MIQELERVALMIDLPEHHLKAGDMGTVVDITRDGQEYTIEFFTLDDETFAVLTTLRALKVDELSPLEALRTQAHGGGLGVVR